LLELDILEVIGVPGVLGILGVPGVPEAVDKVDCHEVTNEMTNSAVCTSATSL
jgi:hypothetical protein